MDRTARILRNKTEVLLQRKDQLRREIAKTRERITPLRKAYDSRWAESRAAALRSLEAIRQQPPMGPFGFRHGFAFGLGFSLLLGLGTLFAG
jgi:hypothetical protein